MEVFKCFWKQNKRENKKKMALEAFYFEKQAAAVFFNNKALLVWVKAKSSEGWGVSK